MWSRARKLLLAGACACGLWLGGPASTAKAVDWDLFYHYPYVYYPQNYRSPYGMQGSDPLYHRYSPDQQIPVYRKDKWYNFLPEGHRYHWGHHFVLDMM